MKNTCKKCKKSTSILGLFDFKSKSQILLKIAFLLSVLTSLQKFNGPYYVCSKKMLPLVLNV